ncbi:MAG: hypothetical protein MPK62_14590 [Alphaproteobacteria bacterium]|nr:hypothetical protein [Alphaproteobacteria bacterium]
MKSRKNHFILIIGSFLIMNFSFLYANNNNLSQCFSYLKQGRLILGEKTGPQHSINSHLGWAKGQNKKVLTDEILRLIIVSYEEVINHPSLSKEKLNSAFAHIKQAQLIINRKTGRQHSLNSHKSWGRGQTPLTLKKEIAYQLKTIYFGLK